MKRFNSLILDVSILPEQAKLYSSESPERRGLTHNNCSESAYTGLHPDGYLSESNIYESYPDGY